MTPDSPPGSVALGLDIAQMEKVAFLLKTTAHPTRIAIVQLLATQPSLSVTELGHQLNVEQSLLSHHLSGMRRKGILASARNGKNMRYSLKMRELITVIQSLAGCILL